MSFIFTQSSIPILPELQIQLEFLLQSSVPPDYTLTLQFFQLDEKLNLAAIKELKKQITQLHLAHTKFFVVLNLHQASIVVQNALLKILEEPPTHLDFVLLCQNSGSLLPTITSRCFFLNSQSTSQSPITLPIDLSPLADFWQLTSWHQNQPLSVVKNLQTNFERQFKTLTQTRPDCLKGTYALELFSQFFQTCTFLLDRHLYQDYDFNLTQITALLTILPVCLKYLQANVSPKHVFNYLLLNFDASL